MNRCPLSAALATTLLCALSTRASAADKSDAGREHAKKANRLANAGKCRPALAEFTAAYEILRDPAILFNRAECERKLGLEDSALSDYRNFIAGMPKAPNREAVERRIAELDHGGQPPSRPAAEQKEAPVNVAPSLPPTLPRKGWIDEDIQ